MQKKTDEVRNSTAQIFIQEKQPLRIKVSYGNEIGAALIIDRTREELKLIAANLQLGAGDPDWPKGSGLYISGNFDVLNWDKIKEYMSQSSTTNVGELKFQGVDIKAKAINLSGLQLTQVSLQATPVMNNWNVKISSVEASGMMVIPAKFVPQSQITANFDRLILRSNTETKQETFITDVKSLPSISFNANSVTYNNMNLGEVSFKTNPTPNGLAIRSLRIVSSGMNLNATGSWSQGNITRLQGTIRSSNVSELINSLGLDAHNFIASDGRLEFNFNWNDPPYATSLNKLSGTASLNIGRGRIVDVGQTSGATMGIGRMLGIFSLQSIPRRLSLDFSDVFQKGYTFDFIRGTFNIRNGNAYTNDTIFDGALARLSINGRIGLANKDFDFMLSVTPYNVTSGLPLAATLLSAGNPVVGLAAVAVNTMISPAVSKAATFHYTVRGPWSNPTWTSINDARR